MSSAADSFDVVVLGGGPAGLVAALQAARAGANTLLVEKAAQLGGTTTTGGVNAIQSFFAYGVQVIAGIGWEMASKSFTAVGEKVPGPSDKDRAGVTNTIVDKATFCCVVDEAVLDAGIDLRLHTMLGDITQQDDGGWLLTLCGKEGLYTVSGKMVIDASGDANAITRAGLPVEHMTERQPGTLVLRLAGYDADQLDFDTIQKNFEAAMAAGEMKSSDTGWSHGDIRNLLNWYGGNCIHVVADNATDSHGRTNMELEARRIMLRLIKFMRRQPGLEKFHIPWFAPETGVRETTIIQGQHRITHEEYMGGHVYDDAICYSFYPIDVHQEDGIDYRPLTEGTYPTIPYGALLPTKGRNIIAAGRSACGDRLAFSAYRVQATCMAMGQAAGAAAALAVQQGCDIADVPIEELRDLLAKHAALVPTRHELVTA